ncbi:MAG: phosphatase PAP2 family protein [Eubacteriales bacterium]
MYHELTFLDTRVTKFVMEYSSQKMTLLMKFITTLGSVEILAIIATVMLVILIGISRIYLGVHYPSDVFAGFAAGGFWLTGCILAMQTVRFYRSGLE